MNKKRYISYSEWYTWEYKGYEAYFQQYILGVREPANQPMILGSIIHSVLESKYYNWQEAIKDLTGQPQSTYQRIIEKISKEVPRCKENELKMYVDVPDEDFQLYAGIDGLESGVLIEYKSGASMWTQERADELEQITHYCLAWHFKHEEIPPFCLITISTSNGKHKVIPTHRTYEQIMEHFEKLKKFKQNLLELGIWDKKVSSRQK